MAFGDPSREDAAADAVPTGVAVRLLRGAALVDDHRVALDAAVRVVVADVEGAALSDVLAHVNHGQPLLQLDASVFINGEAGRSRAMRSEVSAEGVVGRGMAYRWESGAFCEA